MVFEDDGGRRIIVPEDVFQFTRGLLDDVDTKKIGKFKSEWFKYLSAQARDIESKLASGEKMTPEDEKALSDHITTFKTNLFQS